MGFRDIFKRELAERQEVAQSTARQQVSEAIERTGVLAEFEPKLRAIVLEAFEAMREVKWPVAKVTAGGLREPTGVTAFAFSRFGASHLTKSVTAEVVIDSNGKLAFQHYVDVVGEGRDATVVSCRPLDSAYEGLLAGVQRTDAPGARTLTLSSAGEVMYSRMTGSDRADNLIYKVEPLADYLADRAAQTVAGT